MSFLFQFLTEPWILRKMTETHKHFHYSNDRRKHQSQYHSVQGYKNLYVIDLLDNSHKMLMSQLLLGQCFLLFSPKKISLNDYSQLSLSFLDSLLATVFLLELKYDAWSHIWFSAQSYQTSFRSKCTVSLGASEYTVSWGNEWYMSFTESTLFFHH